MKLLLFLDREQGLLHDFGRRFAVTAFATTAKIMRRFMQAQQGGHLVHRAGTLAEVIFGQIGKTEFLVRGKFVGQLQLNALAQDSCFAQQRSGTWFFKLEQHLRCLDFDPFARIELHLSGGLGFGQDASGHEFAGFFK